MWSHIAYFAPGSKSKYSLLLNYYINSQRRTSMRGTVVNCLWWKVRKEWEKKKKARSKAGFEPLSSCHHKASALLLNCNHGLHDPICHKAHQLGPALGLLGQPTFLLFLLLLFGSSIFLLGSFPLLLLPSGSCSLQCGLDVLSCAPGKLNWSWFKPEEGLRRSLVTGADFNIRCGIKMNWKIY